MLGSALVELEKVFIGLVIMALIFVPLGVWKLFEIVVWAFGHIKFV